MARKKKKKRQKWSDFTLDEQFTLISLIVCMIFLIQHYILAYLGKDPMTELAVIIVSAVVVILVKYSVKSFKGKRAEENMKYRRDLNNVPETEDLFDENETEEDELWDI